uniref:(northern house mosquito) hypothetical protein n=1 Tax=Culex pipiens TaxID=7175 RepID=A0A8D8DDU3_CULPI
MRTGFVRTSACGVASAGRDSCVIATASASHRTGVDGTAGTVWGILRRKSLGLGVTGGTRCLTSVEVPVRRRAIRLRKVDPSRRSARRIASSDALVGRAT